jgi:hypothetical protein
MSDTASPTEKQAPAEIIAGRIESWLRVGLGRHYVAEAVITYLGMAGYVIVPREPTAEMIEAACKSMSPGRRPTPDRVSVREKHSIRWRAMVEAAGR